MKLNEMNIVITGANGTVASELISYFSNRVAFMVGTVRQLKANVENENNSRLLSKWAHLIIVLLKVQSNA